MEKGLNVFSRKEINDTIRRELPNKTNFMEEKSSGSGAITAVVILILVAIVAWVAYSQGLFTGSKDSSPDNGVKIEVGGSGDDSSNPTAY